MLANFLSCGSCWLLAADFCSFRRAAGLLDRGGNGLLSAGHRPPGPGRALIIQLRERLQQTRRRLEEETDRLRRMEEKLDQLLERGTDHKAESAHTAGKES